ncbi:MAG: CBS domain-containing protein [Anaerolineae bacterium]|nr:CBS domain-containing protein [Anaerolineae bacterium]
MITVSDLLKQKGEQVWVVEHSASVSEALRLMAQKDIGALVVLKKGKLCGIFSERDFTRRMAGGRSFNLNSPVSRLMTSDVLTATPKDTVEDCMKIMTEHHIRHLPVVDGERLAGMISIGDVVKSIISGQKSFIRQLEDYISGRW